MTTRNNNNNNNNNKKKKVKISSFEQDGIRDGIALTTAMKMCSDTVKVNNNITGDIDEDTTTTTTTTTTLILCRLSFTTEEKSQKVLQFLRQKVYSWNRIVLDKCCGRWISTVIQTCIACTTIFEIKQHQRYDAVQWDFPLVNSTTGACCRQSSSSSSSSSSLSQLKELHFSGLRFRESKNNKNDKKKKINNTNNDRDPEAIVVPAVEQQQQQHTFLFFHSLSKILSGDGDCNLEVLEFNSCRFDFPHEQYPILFEGIKQQQNNNNPSCSLSSSSSSLRRLWMVKCSNLKDHQFVELFSTTTTNDNNNNNDNNDDCSNGMDYLEELGFSYNGCGYNGSRALANYLIRRNRNRDRERSSSTKYDAHYHQEQQQQEQQQQYQVERDKTERKDAYHHHLHHCSSKYNNYDDNNDDNHAAIGTTEDSINERRRGQSKASSASSLSVSSSPSSSSSLKVLYLNRQQGNSEMDIKSILIAAAAAGRGLQLNLSQNYVQNKSKLLELQTIVDSHRNVITVEMERMTYEVPDNMNTNLSNIMTMLMTGSNNNNKKNNKDTNTHSDGNVTGNGNETLTNNRVALTQDEITKLNVAVGRIKYVLGRLSEQVGSGSRAISKEVVQSLPSPSGILPQSIESRTQDSSSLSVSTVGPASTVITERADSSSLSSSGPICSSSSSLSSAPSHYKYYSGLDCIVPDMIIVLRLQHKQQQCVGMTPMAMMKNDDSYYSNWIPTFLRKAVKGNIEILRPLLFLSSSRSTALSSSSSNFDSGGNVSGSDYDSNYDDAITTTPIVTLNERRRLEELWYEIQELQSNVDAFNNASAYRNSNTKNNITKSMQSSSLTTTETVLEDDFSSSVSTSIGNTKKDRNNNQKNKSIKIKNRKNKSGGMVDGYGDNNDTKCIIRAAYDALPKSFDYIPTTILEPSSSIFLALPSSTHVEDNSNHVNISSCPPHFIDGPDELERLRYNLSQRPPPYRLPKLIAIDSEWYVTAVEKNEGTDTCTTTFDTKTKRKKNSKRNRMKNKNLAIATMQIAYIEENVLAGGYRDNSNDSNSDNHHNDDDLITKEGGMSSSSSSSTFLRSFVIDLLSDKVGFQKAAKEFISWILSPSCDLLILGFAFGGDLRELRKYVAAGETTTSYPIPDFPVGAAVVESRCLDLQLLLASENEFRSGQLPGLKRLSEKYFKLPLRKDDQWYEIFHQ